MNTQTSAIGIESLPLQPPALSSWLRRAAACSPENSALETSERQWSYAQLLADVAALSEDLKQRGLQPGDRVGIAATRSAETVVAILATIDAGLAYVPLDLSYPAPRLRIMVDEAQPRLVLGEASALQELERLIGDFPRSDQPAPPATPLFAAEPDLTYVLFTSGSTGKPKGVALGARPLAHLIAFHAADPRLGQAARTLQFAPLSFDVHLQEILSSVACAGTLVLLPEAVRRDPEQLFAAVCELNIDRLFMPYVALQMLAEASTSGQPLALRDVISAGEQLQITPAIKRLFERLPAARLHNHYGPTESHVVLVHELPKQVSQWPAIPPIGQPLAHVRLALRDGQGRHDAESEMGELLLGGECLAHGYLGSAALTAERFLEAVPGLPGRWYATGDLVRRDAAGDYTYLGRADQQLKVDGFRIEPGEIELALMAHPSVREAVVTAPELPDLGRQLIAHVVLRDGAEVGPLRDHLRSRLPEHMVPLRFIPLPSLPLTPSGKIDRGQLPLPAASSSVQDDGFASDPRAFVRSLWQELLGIDALADDANLFDLGARSLLVLRFSARLRSMGGHGLAIADIYDHPTVQGISDALQKQPELPRSSARNRQETAGVAIVGMALRTPGAADVEAFWQQLLDGREGIHHFSPDELDASVPASLRERPNFVAARGVLADAARFDAGFFGISSREATVLDPQQRLLLELSWNALEHASIDPWHSGSRVGVYAGTSNNSYITALRQEQPELVHQYGDFATMLASEKDYVATRIAHRLNLNGPAVSVHTACSTSLVAVAQAWQSLTDGQCDVALAGGASVLVPQESGYLHVEGGMESADGHCRPFDAEATGTVFSSGGAMVVLKRLEDALADGDTIHAVIRGVGLNNDGGDKASFTAPSAHGQATAIRMALDHAQVSARSIGFVEAHGTATALGDPIEVAALSRAWRADTTDTQFCGLGSVKSNLGHMAAAAGVVGLIKASLALAREQIPRTLHFKQANPQLDLEHTPFKVVAETTAWPRAEEPRRAAVSSFGVGGTNAHLVLEEAPAASAQPNLAFEPDAASAFLFPLSARSPKALQQRAADLASHLEHHTQTCPIEVAATLMRGRSEQPQRASVVATNLPEAIAALRSLPAAVQALSRPRLVFMFPGQGSQHAGMARGLYDQVPAFREALDRCAEITKGIGGVDLLPWLVEAEPGNADTSAQLADTRHAQPALFSMSYALASWLASVGVKADAMIGHSVGEYAAACLAGVMSLEDGLAAVIARGRAMALQPKGAMLAVRASVKQLEPLLPQGVEIAGCNAPTLTVVSGTHEAIAALAATLESQTIGSSALNVSHAFHSAMMDAALPAVQAALNEVVLHAPQTQVYSCISGATLTAEEATDAQYWARQVREPVQFSRALSSELAQANTVYVEVGPGQALCALLRQHRSPNGTVARHVALLGSAQKPGDAANHALQALGQLWSHGVEVAWPVPKNARRAHLPTYPFAGEHFWFQRHAMPQTSENLPSMPDTLTTLNRPQRIELELQRIFGDVSGLSPEEISRERSLIDQGMDSLSLTQTTLEIENVFGIKLRFRRLLEDLDTVERLASFLDSELAPDRFAPATAPVIAQATALTPPANTTFLQQTIAQQMKLMAQQLVLLGAQPEAPERPLPSPVQTPVALQASASLIEKPFGASPHLTLSAQQNLSPAQRVWLDGFIARCDAKFGKSKAFSQKNRQLMADPRVVTGFNPLWKDLVYPLVVERSKGTRMWDLDGNELIDLLASFGANFLGYQTPDLVQAMVEQVQTGIELGPQHPLSAEVAELISELTGMERVAFCNTGSEAVVGALRIARTVTGRKTVAIFTNSYHGIVDEVIVRGSKQLRPLAAAPGIPPSAIENMLVLDYASDDSLRVLRERAHELAAIMIEPIQNKVPSLQPRAFVQSLREICDAAGCALIFDECVTGFRVAPGGAQEFYGIRGDIACYGKIIGGGLPLSAIAGSARWMDALDGGQWQYGDASYPEAGVTYFAGTFVRHPLALAAAKASLLHIRQAGPGLYRDINERTQSLVTRLNTAFAARGAPVKAVHCTSLWRLIWDDGQKNISLFYWLARFHGLHLYEQFGHFLTAAMGDDDTDRIVNVFTAALDELMALGFIAPRDGTPPPRGGMPDNGQCSLQEGPLAPGQTERWLAGNFDPAARRALNESLCICLAGDVDKKALELALHDVLGRHEAFRISFDTEQPLQRLNAPQPFDIAHVDLRNQARAEEALDHFCRESNGRAFPLSLAPLAAVSMLQLSDGRTVVHLVASHLIFDGWASSVFNAELAQAYRARCIGTLPAWTEPASPLVFGKEEQTRFDGPQGLDDLAFWQARLSNPPPPLSLGDLEPAGPRHFGADTERSSIDGRILAELRAQAKAAGATLFQLLLTALTMVLHRRTASSDFVVSIPYAGQSLQRRGPLVGDGVLDLPLRLQCKPGDTAAGLLDRVRSDLMDALDHPLMTQGTVARALGLRSGGDRPPLTGVYFNLNPLVDLSAFAPLTATLHEGRKAGLLGEVFFNFYEKPETLSLDLHYSTEYFSTGQARELVRELLEQCASLARSPEGSLALSSPAVDPRLIAWNKATNTPLEPRARLEQWVSRQAAQTPDAMALMAQGVTLSYTALESRANRFAQVLLGRGIGTGSLVGVCLSRGPDLIPALLGILKTGAAYVPLDPGFPKDRLHYMVEDAGVRLVITDAINASVSGVSRERQLRIDDDAATLAAAPNTALTAQIGRPDDAPAYVIYTSGSTGKPKGVVLPQKAVCNFLASMRIEPGLKPADRLLAVTTLSFDIAVLELFLPLTTGASVVLADRDEAMDGEVLARLITDQRINVMQATPTTWHMLLDADWLAPVGFRALCGGEPLPPSLAERMLAAGVELWNMYGPTETTVWSTLCRITDPKQAITIGRPIANTQVWVLDEQLKPCGIAQEGELCIGGAGVAIGYFKRPDLTAEKFVPNPFDATPGARLYRTGDLARWREDGMLEHMGRLDFQVKIRGYRIELGEIEARLAKLPGVARTVVVAREDDPGDVRLIAYAVAQVANTPDPAQLREALRSDLPDYMLPQQIVLLDALPLLPNGKIDRKSLPLPAVAAAALVKGDRAPRNELEKQLAAAMASVLKRQEVGVDDDFFSLGGHSLLAARLIGQINRELSLKLALRTLFESPTVEQLAQAVSKARGADAAPPRAPIPRRREQHTAPLTVMQERINFVERMQPGRIGYHAPSGHRLRGPIDLDAFDRSFQEVVRRQDAFRTSIEATDDGFVQRVDEALRPSLMPLTDLSTLPEPQQEQALQDDMNRQAAQLFALDQAPLIRARLYKLADDHHALFLMAHHIIWDGWSFDIFYAEMAAHYPAFQQDRPSPLPPLPLSYGDFAAWHNDWMQSDEIREQSAYWKRQLGTARPRPETHVDKPRPQVGSGNAANEHFTMDASLVADVQVLARNTGSTTSIVLLAAFAALMSQWMDEPMPTIGMPVRGRPESELEGVMGFFNNLLPLRLLVDMSLSMNDWVRQVRGKVTNAIANQDVPFEHISQELHLPAGAIYQALFNFQDVRARETRWGDLQHERIHVSLDGASEDMNLWLVESESGVSGGFKYDPDVFFPANIAALRDRFANLIRVGTQSPELPLCKLLTPTDAELAALQAWEATLPALAGGDIGGLIKQHWLTRPQDAALSIDGKCWTGDELMGEFVRIHAAIKNSLNSHRRLVVVTTDDPLHQVIGLLAAAQAGGSWCSLANDDPNLHIALNRHDLALVIGPTKQVSALPAGIPHLTLDGSPLAKTVFSAAMSTGVHIFDTGRLAGLLGGLSAAMKVGPADAWLCSIDPERPLFAYLQAAAGLVAGARAVLDASAVNQDTTDLSLLIREKKATIVHAPAAAWDRCLSAQGQTPLRGVTAVVDGVVASSPRLYALFGAGLSVVTVYREAEFGLPLAAGALKPGSQAASLGRPLQAGLLKVTDAYGQKTAPGIAGDMQALAPGVEAQWQTTGTRARWGTGGQLQLLSGFRGASFSAQPADIPQAGLSAVPTLPMTPTEREMLRLWCELLGRSDIGLDDNFFDLGGYSLLAMTLVAKVEVRLGKKIQPASLLESATVRRLSALVEPGINQSSLIKLRPGTGGPGVFFIHDADGEVLLYRNLAVRLDPRHPVYAVQPLGDEERPIVHTRIAEMAEHYMRQIQSVQPHGPYILAGLCAGGDIAFEVACLLQAQGERIATLALLESAHASAVERPRLVSRRRLVGLSQALSIAGKDQSALARAAQAATTLWRKATAVVQYELGSRITKIRLDAALKQMRSAQDKGERPNRGSRRLTVRQVVSFAQRTANGHSQLSGNALLLRARQSNGVPDDQPFIELYEDPLFGWQAGVLGKVIAADVDGGHSSLLQEPFVASTQAVLQMHIDAALKVLEEEPTLVVSNTGRWHVAEAPKVQTQDLAKT